MDLLRASRDRYRVEALTGNSHVDGLRSCEGIWRALRGYRRPDRLAELKMRWPARHPNAVRRSASWKQRRDGGLVKAAVSGRGGLSPALGPWIAARLLRSRTRNALSAPAISLQARGKGGACPFCRRLEHNALFHALGSGNQSACGKAASAAGFSRRG